MKTIVRVDLDDERGGCSEAECIVFLFWEAPDRSVGFSGGWTVDDTEVSLVSDDGSLIPYNWSHLSKHDRERITDAAVAQAEEVEGDRRAEERYDDGYPSEDDWRIEADHSGF